MKRNLTVAVALLLVGLALSGSDCIMEEKIVQLVVLGESCTDDFVESHDSETWTTDRTYDVSDELDDILADNDIDKSQIISAEIVSATYMVTDPPVHDWEVSGAILITYGAETDTIVNYTEQSLFEIDGVEKYVDLHGDGVDIFHHAIEDYLDDLSPVLTFSVANGDVEDDPSPSDPIEFSWIACLKIHVVVEDEYEWPDIFRD